MKKNVTISLSQKAIDRIKQIAEDENRSVSSMIEVLILNYKYKSMVKIENFKFCEHCGTWRNDHIDKCPKCKI